MSTIGKISWIILAIIAGILVCAVANATEFRLRNYAGDQCSVWYGSATNVYLLPRGDCTWQVPAGATVGVVVGTNQVESWSNPYNDQQRVTMEISGHGTRVVDVTDSSGRWAIRGFVWGTVLFGSGLIVRMLKGITGRGFE